jgi:hypothetical protein
LRHTRCPRCCRPGQTLPPSCSCPRSSRLCRAAAAVQGESSRRCRPGQLAPRQRRRQILASAQFPGLRTQRRGMGPVKKSIMRDMVLVGWVPRCFDPGMRCGRSGWARWLRRRQSAKGAQDLRDGPEGPVMVKRLNEDSARTVYA